MEIQDIILNPPLKRIYLCQRNPQLMNSFWKYPQAFSESLCLAAHIKYGGKNRSKNIQDIIYFIEFTILHLLHSPVDVLSAIKYRQENESIDAFLSELVKHPFISETLVLQLLHSDQFLKETEGCDDWLDWPLRLHAKRLLSSSAPRRYSTDSLIPCGVSRNRFISEYILSWAFEADRLSDDGIAVYSQEFPKKYKMLINIKTHKK